MENKEKLDLVEILKDCLQDTPLYSPIYGEVKFCCINNAMFPIVVENSQKNLVHFNKQGRFSNCTDAECMLFPSKDCRDWSQFKTPEDALPTLYQLRENYIRRTVIRMKLEKELEKY